MRRRDGVTNCPIPGVLCYEDTMPIRFWTHDCCNILSAQRTCSCGHVATESRWNLGVFEMMADHQIYDGLTPRGPHHRRLMPAITWTRRCTVCDGVGLIDTHRGERYRICRPCHGFGRFPLPGAPESEAFRRKVARKYPEVVLPYDAALAFKQMRALLLGRGRPVLNLASGRIGLAQAPAAHACKAGG